MVAAKPRLDEATALAIDEAIEAFSIGLMGACNRFRDAVRTSAGLRPYSEVLLESGGDPRPARPRSRTRTSSPAAAAAPAAVVDDEKDLDLVLATLDDGAYLTAREILTRTSRPGLAGALGKPVTLKIVDDALAKLLKRDLVRRRAHPAWPDRIQWYDPAAKAVDAGKDPLPTFAPPRVSGQKKKAAGAFEISAETRKRVDAVKRGEDPDKPPPKAAASIDFTALRYEEAVRLGRAAPRGSACPYVAPQGGYRAAWLWANGGAK